MAPNLRAGYFLSCRGVKRGWAGVPASASLLAGAMGLVHADGTNISNPKKHVLPQKHAGAYVHFQYVPAQANSETCLNRIFCRLRDESCPPPVDVEDIIKSVDGNLCRCTGYRPILEAFKTFCKNEDSINLDSTTFDKSKFKEYCPKTDDPGKQTRTILKWFQS